jgi:hypothetical protein
MSRPLSWFDQMEMCNFFLEYGWKGVRVIVKRIPPKAIRRDAGFLVLSEVGD